MATYTVLATSGWQQARRAEMMATTEERQVIHVVLADDKWTNAMWTNAMWDCRDVERGRHPELQALTDQFTDGNLAWHVLSPGRTCPLCGAIGG